MAETIALFSGEPGDSETLRQLEALLFAAREPMTEAQLAARLGEEADLTGCLAQLQTVYANRGVNLVESAGGWAFRTAPDLAPLLAHEREASRKLSQAALETLAIIAYHQPVTRAEIEEIRGVAVAKGTLDILLETGWVRLRGRRRVAGRPTTFGTTAAFLDHFSLGAIADLPGLDDLKGAGLLDGTPPAGFTVPLPRDDDALDDDEDPLDSPPGADALIAGEAEVFPRDLDDGHRNDDGNRPSETEDRSVPASGDGGRGDEGRGDGRAGPAGPPHAD